MRYKKKKMAKNGIEMRKLRQKWPQKNPIKIIVDVWSWSLRTVRARVLTTLPLTWTGLDSFPITSRNSHVLSPLTTETKTKRKKETTFFFFFFFFVFLWFLPRAGPKTTRTVWSWMSRFVFERGGVSDSSTFVPTNAGSRGSTALLLRNYVVFISFAQSWLFSGEFGERKSVFSRCRMGFLRKDSHFLDSFGDSSRLKLGRFVK